MRAKVEEASALMAQPCLCCIPADLMAKLMQQNAKRLLVQIDWMDGSIVCGVKSAIQPPSLRTASRADIAQSTVQISPALAQLFSLPSETMVNVDIAPALPGCARVVTHAATLGDWQALTINASALEGEMLHQISAVKAGEKFPLKIGSQTISLQIDEVHLDEGNANPWWEWAGLSSDTAIVVKLQEKKEVALKLSWRRFRAIVTPHLPAAEFDIAISSSLQGSAQLVGVNVNRYEDVMTKRLDKETPSEISSAQSQSRGDGAATVKVQKNDKDKQQHKHKDKQKQKQKTLLGHQKGSDQASPKSSMSSELSVKAARIAVDHFLPACDIALSTRVAATLGISTFDLVIVVAKFDPTIAGGDMLPNTPGSLACDDVNKSVTFLQQSVTPFYVAPLLSARQERQHVHRLLPEWMQDVASSVHSIAMTRTLSPHLARVLCKVGIGSSDSSTHVHALQQYLGGNVSRASEGDEGGVSHVRHVLVAGRRGSGRTAILRQLKQDMDALAGIYCQHMSCQDLKGLTTAAQLSRIRLCLRQCLYHAPSALLLDDFDAICSSDMEGPESVQFLSSLGQLFLDVPSSSQLAIITTAVSANAIHPVVSRLGFWTPAHTVALPPLDEESLLQTLKSMNGSQGSSGRHVWSRERHWKEEEKEERSSFACMDGLPHKSEYYFSHQDSIEDVWDAMKPCLKKGISLCDVTHILRLAQARAIEEVELAPSVDLDHPTSSSVAVSQKDVFSIAAEYVPLHAQALGTAVTKLCFDDVGGLHGVKKQLQKTIGYQLLFPEVYESAPIALRNGILLHGPTGCGKTRLAHALAGEFDINIITVNGPELLNKYIGASEQAVRDVFGKASQAAPCILFFDELDAIAPPRGSSSNGVSDRVVNQLLTYLDGVEERTGIFVIGATSRKEFVDPAVLRAGRLGEHLYCGPPGTAEEKEEILRVFARETALANDVDLHSVAAECCLHEARSRGLLSGADLKAIVTNAQLKLAHEVMKSYKFLTTRAASQFSDVLAQDAARDTVGISDAVAPPRPRVSASHSGSPSRAFLHGSKSALTGHGFLLNGSGLSMHAGRGDTFDISHDDGDVADPETPLSPEEDSEGGVCDPIMPLESEAFETTHQDELLHQHHLLAAVRDVFQQKSSTNGNGNGNDNGSDPPHSKQTTSHLPLAGWKTTFG